MKQLLFLTTLITTLMVVVNAGIIKRENQTPDYYIMKNISYGPFDDNKLDVYYDNNSIEIAKPTIIYIHGGYWCEGDKNEDRPIGLRIQSENYVAVIANYRLYPTTSNIDDMVDDIYNIISWAKNNIETYGGDANNMTLIGFNAGAHLASLTLLKAALGMDVNGKQITNDVLFKHLILYNSPFTFDKDERLEFEINNMKNTATLAPSLAYLERYANAKEGLFLGKKGYDEVEILKKQGDLAIYSLGAEKISFIECDNDTNYPIGSSQEMMDEVKRVIDDIEIVKEVYPGNYDYIIQGVKNGDPEPTNVFMSLIKSAYEI